jgi:hypothetical protein
MVALGFSLVVLLTGCTSRTAYVIARRDASFDLNANSKICLAPHAQPRSSELTLQRDLLTALQDHGISLVPHDQADFTLTYWLDDSWKPGKKVVYYQNGAWSERHPMANPSFYQARGVIGTRSPMIYVESSPTSQRVIDAPFYVQGIRLKLYPKNSTGGVEFKTAWEGYIEGGARVSHKREPVLLRTLLHHFGQDFNGRAPLMEQPN